MGSSSKMKIISPSQSLSAIILVIFVAIVVTVFVLLFIMRRNCSVERASSVIADDIQTELEKKQNIMLCEKTQQSTEDAVTSDECTTAIGPQPSKPSNRRCHVFGETGDLKLFCVLCVLCKNEKYEKTHYFNFLCFMIMHY